MGGGGTRWFTSLISLHSLLLGIAGRSKFLLSGERSTIYSKHTYLSNRFFFLGGGEIILSKQLIELDARMDKERSRSIEGGALSAVMTSASPAPINQGRHQLGSAAAFHQLLAVIALAILSSDCHAPLHNRRELRPGWRSKTHLQTCFFNHTLRKCTLQKARHVESTMTTKSL